MPIEIQVQGTDQIVEFPDGTDPAVIQRVMAQNFPVQQAAPPAAIAGGDVMRPAPTGGPLDPQDVVGQRLMDRTQVPEGIGAAEQEGPGFFQSVADFFTGAPRETRATRELPEIQESGLLAGENQALVASVTPALLTATDINEMAQILSTNFPDVGIAYDEKGNAIARNNRTGAMAILNQPGLSKLDIMQGLGLAAAFTPAGRAATIPTAVGRAAGTEAGLQAVQAVSGGEFDPEEVALSGAFGGIGKKVEDVISAGLASRRAAKEAQRAAEGGAEQSVRQVAEITGETPEAVVEGIRRGRQEDIAAMAQIDQEILDAANRLGPEVRDQLLTSHAAKNVAYREIEQGLKSIPGSKLKEQEVALIGDLARQADDLITDFGGEIDKAAVSQQIKDQATNTIEQLGKQAEDVYADIGAAMKGKSGPATNTRAFLREQAQELGGKQNLDALEKRLMNITAKENVPYALIDRERKKIGQAINQKAGPYKDEAVGALKNMYRLLTEDQEAMAAAEGMDAAWGAAKGIVSKRKELEDNSIVLLGKELADAAMPKIGRAIKKLPSGDYKDFRKYMNALPQDQREKVVLTAMNDAFTLGSRKEKQLALSGFDDWYKDLKRNPQTMAMLREYLPEGASSRLDDLAKVVGGVRRAQESAITTGRIMAVPAQFDMPSVIDKVVGPSMKAAAAKLPGVFGGLIDDVVSRGKTARSEAADKLLASPQFRAAIEELATTGAERQSRRIQALERSKAYKDWLRSLPAEQSRAIAAGGLPSWLMESEEPLDQGGNGNTQSP